MRGAWLQGYVTTRSHSAHSGSAPRWTLPRFLKVTQGIMCGAQRAAPREAAWARQRPRVPCPPARASTHAARCSCLSKWAIRARAAAAMAASRLPAASPGATPVPAPLSPPAHSARARPQASDLGGSGLLSHQSKSHVTPPQSQPPPLKLP